MHSISTYCYQLIRSSISSIVNIVLCLYISLLNVDLKLLSYVLAQRLKNVLEKIVNNDQTGYIKNRFIGFNHRQIQDIIDFAESYNVEGAIVFVDFKKAFDSLEWTFILTTLKHFGFNE